MTDRMIDEVITDLAEDLKDLIDFGADCAVELSHKIIQWFTPEEKVKEEQKADTKTDAAAILRNIDPALIAQLINAAVKTREKK